MISRFFLVCVLLFSLPAFATDAYEVTAPAIGTPLSPVGGSETIITHKHIENYQEIFLKEPLIYAPSVNLSSQAPLSGFSIRGARSAQNLVLFEGIQVNDPAAGGGVDLSNFLNADLEIIEVLPGPQTLADGPGALGGVIQLIPKRGCGKPSLKAHGEGGSFRTGYGILTAQGEEGPLQFSVTAAGFNRGPSSFVNALHANRQGDHYRNGTLSSRIDYALTDNWEVEGIIRYSEQKAQFDELRPIGAVFLPHEARNFSDTQILLSSLENRWGNNAWDHSLTASYARTLRKTDTPSFHNATIGARPMLSYRTEFKVNAQHTLSGGLEGEQERATDLQLHKRAYGGIFLIHVFKPCDATALKAGIRGDHYQSLGNHITCNFGIDHKVSYATNVRTSYGTNFKPPVLSDLFQDTPWQISNPLLKPEKSQSFEAGVDQILCENKAKLSITGFFTQIKGIILSHQRPDWKWQRINGGKRVSKGVDMTLSLKLLPTLEMKSALTLIDSQDFPHKHKAPLIPAVKGATGLQWQAFSKLSLFIQGYGVTSQKDGVTHRTLAPYGIIAIGSNYELTPRASFFWRIENLTNTHYEEVFGYGARGRAFFFGIEAKT
jgi:vitamin B12 transporter